MSLFFILFLLAALAAVITFVVAPGEKRTTITDRYGNNPQERVEPSLKKYAVIPARLAGLFLFLSVVYIVPTRDIGVVTSFGRPVAAKTNGLHAKAPWDRVHKLDGAIQIDNHVKKTKDNEDVETDGATTIRLGNESLAKVDNIIRWQIRPDAGTRLYREYRDMDKIRDSLVTRELTASLNEVLGEYDPLAQIRDANATQVKLNRFSRQVTADLRKRVGKDIMIKSVIIPIIRFDNNTQKRINQYTTEVANTKVAEQKELTAKAQARANAALRESVSNDPNVLSSDALTHWKK